MHAYNQGLRASASVTQTAALAQDPHRSHNSETLNRSQRCCSVHDSWISWIAFFDFSSTAESNTAEQRPLNVQSGRK